MDLISVIVGAVGGLIIGVIIGKLLFSTTKKQLQIAEQESANIIRDAKREAETIFKNKQLESKEKYLQLKAEYREYKEERNRKINERDKKLRQREKEVSKQSEQLRRTQKETEKLRGNLDQQLEIASEKQDKLDQSHREHVRKLEQLAQLSAEEARNELVASLVDEARTKAMAQVKQILDESKASAAKDAKKIILQTIQRTAAEQTIENSVSVFNLETDDQKGQIIGREGRNIRALEAATGVELIVDDTPEAIIISGFDSVRREVARLSLQRLTSDGRIHPARIEEVVKKTKRQMDEHIMEIGERTVIDLGINGLHSKLIRMVGRMRFRSSYGQNLLQHSRETANLCATMAAEMGLNPKLAKRAGLLHDIGKVPEEESELSHALLGAKLCEKFGEHPSVVNAVGAHHDEIEMKYIISPIIQSCDAISGARPGARREILEHYVKRIKDLEKMALDHKGVESAYAIQAGRELRVIVEADKVSDAQSDELSFVISQKIQEEMQYPGHIKVTVIREKRAVAYAK